MDARKYFLPIRSAKPFLRSVPEDRGAKGKNTTLVLDVTNHPKGNWKLVVQVNGKQAFSKDIEETKWQRFEVDLTKYAGKSVSIELWNQATGWSHEAAYWSQLILFIQHSNESGQLTA